MIKGRSYAAGSMFEGDNDIWWITGGVEDFDKLNQTEYLSVPNSDFIESIDLPSPLSEHVLINVNSTHMVALGGYFPSDQVYIFDRSVYLRKNIKYFKLMALKLNF